MLFFFENTSRYCLRTALGIPCSCCSWKCFSWFFFQFLDWPFWLLFVQYLIYSQSKLNGFFSYTKFMGGACLFLEFIFKQKIFLFLKRWFNFLVCGWIATVHYLENSAPLFLSLWLKKIDHAIFGKLLVQFYSSSDF